MENNGIGIANLPNLLHSEFRKTPCYLNIMVVGSHGLGKTTFLNKIIGNPILKIQPFEKNETNPFWYQEAKCNIQISTVEVVENGFMTRFNIIEVDGLGDHVDNTGCYTPIVELIESKFEAYAAAFKENTSKFIEDHRIHMCFYFLEPIFSISIPNLETMKKLSALCTIIPIIAKSDLLSSAQVPIIKSTIKRILEDNDIAIFNTAEYAEEGPFLIFSESRGESTSVDGEKLWRESAYESQQVNDFSVVKRLIIERHAYQLIKETDQFYDNYRITRLLQQSTDKDIKDSKERIEKMISDYQNEVRELQLKIRESQTISEN